MKIGVVSLNCFKYNPTERKLTLRNYFTLDQLLDDPTEQFI